MFFNTYRLLTTELLGDTPFVTLLLIELLVFDAFTIVSESDDVILLLCIKPIALCTWCTIVKFAFVLLFAEDEIAKNREMNNILNYC